MKIKMKKKNNERTKNNNKNLNSRSIIIQFSKAFSQIYFLSFYILKKNTHPHPPLINIAQPHIMNLDTQT